MARLIIDKDDKKINLIGIESKHGEKILIKPIPLKLIAE
jgi:hypothetical protein